MSVPDDSGRIFTSIMDTPRSRTKSMEDSDTLQDRKRPRLEEGGDLLPADEALTDTGCPEMDSNAPSQPSKLTPAQDDASPTSPVAYHTPPKISNKVTINTRPTSSAAQTSPHVSPVTSASKMEPNENEKAESQPTSREANASVSPSLSRSPEIEIAEPEDIDQDGHPTRWTPLSRVPGPSTVLHNLDEHYVYQTFPNARSGGIHKTQAVVAEFAESLRTDRSNLRIARPLGTLNEWMEQLLLQCDRMPLPLLVDDCEFWTSLPMLVEALLRRKLDLPKDVDVQVIERFFFNFACLASRFVDLDIDLVAKSFVSTDVHQILSSSYLDALTVMLNSRGHHLYLGLQTGQGANSVALVSRLVGMMIGSPCEILPKLHLLVRNISACLHKKPMLGAAYKDSLRLITQIVLATYETTGQNSTSNLDLIDISRTCFGICREVDHTLQLSISKQWTWFTMDTGNDMIHLLTTCLRYLTLSDVQIAMSLLGQDPADWSHLPNSQVSDIAFHDWKFTVYWKAITSGRMEVRTQGMELLQIDLVQVFHQFIKDSGPADIPLVQHLVSRLRRAKVLQYLISAESHPQLMSRSGNVMAFLAVSKAYTDQDTDLLWDFILENRDSRMVSETIVAVSALVDNMEAIHVDYMFKRLFSLPIHRFDSRMVDFTSQVLKAAHHRGQGQLTNILKIRFFVHLLRAESASEDLSSELRVLVQRWASHCLTEMSRVAILDPGIGEIWTICMADLQERASASTGSLRAVQSIMAQDPKGVMQLLSERFDYPRLVVQEINHIFAASPEHCCTDLFMRHHYIPRMVALVGIIRFVPETMTTSLIGVLWNSIFASGKKHEWARSYAWDTLSNVAGDCVTANSFIDSFANNFFSGLSTGDHDLGTLRFAQAFLAYQIQLAGSVEQSVESILAFPGIDFIWRFILNSPSNGVELSAISVLIKFYLDSRVILQCTREAIETIHNALVDRCINQIIQAAASLHLSSSGSTIGDNRSPAAADGNESPREQELQFGRSLLLLRQFLNGLKANPRYSPPPMAAHVQAVTCLQSGDEITVKYQAFDGRKNPEISIISIGDLNTAQELATLFQDKTGMSCFTTLYRGQPFTLFNNGQTLKELGIGANAGLFILRRSSGSVKDGAGGRRNSTTHVDCQISKNFAQLYGLLDLEPHLSAEIFNFLQVFPVQDEVKALVRDKDADPENVLPLEKPYKLLYSANAFYLALEDELFSSSADVEFVRHSVCTLLAVCRCHLAIGMDRVTERLIMANLIDCLLLALRVNVSADVSVTYALHQSTVVRYLLRSIESSVFTPQPEAQGPSFRLVPCQAFAVLIECILHDDQIWDQLEAQKDFAKVLSALLLRSHTDVRKGTADVLFSLAGLQATKSHMKVQSTWSLQSRFPRGKVQTLLLRIWELLLEILPDTLEHRSTAGEMFDVSLATLRGIDDPPELDVFVGTCKVLLAEYVPTPIVGRRNEDAVAFGLARLLRCAVEPQKTRGLAISHKDLIELLMKKYLLPDLSSESSEDYAPHGLPILKSSIRAEVYALVLELQDDTLDYEVLIKCIKDPLPQNFWEPHFQHERYALRSEAGHAGLRNLSNTCYLNSLFTQLYMNLQFREFILRAPSREQLVPELRKVFALMQNSYGRAVDTSGAVRAIRTYDNESIDIAIQMDVDEFYNLLFDRLESEMLTAEKKNQFRSIYGGQLVQQIKSKECDHISERLEPFSAIQCDIRGKNDLEESLRAYVEGEVMQGDNKYSCSGCDRHVDAVKRACLKVVPDHLIFHLKRFDFDINTMTRCKINDEFGFPDILDMAPYTVENLSGQESNITPDIFELVGVLVHSGTAESGHYYSLIRERPSHKDGQHSWLQFNDADVTAFDHDRLKEYAYGGNDPSLRAPRVWSAYMLFYQRVSSVDQFNSIYPMASPIEPVRLELPQTMVDGIAIDNEMFVNAHCVQDATHAQFVRALLERMKQGEDNDCSEEHDLETRVLLLTLKYIGKVSSRFKELPEVDACFKLLQQYVANCGSCARVILQFLEGNPQSFEAAVMRNPRDRVREQFALLVYKCLNTLFIQTKSSPTNDTSRRKTRSYRITLDKVLEIIASHREKLQTMPRGWDQYFWLVTAIVDLGPLEAQTVLNHDYLYYCLAMIWLDVPEDPKEIRAQFPSVWRLKEKGRVFSYELMMSLLEHLLRHIELSVAAADEDHEQYEQSFSMTRREMSLFQPVLVNGRSRVLPWLSQCLSEGYNKEATMRIIERLASEDKWTVPLFHTIAQGLETDPASLAQPFLHATNMFITCCEEQELVTRLTKKALDCVETIGDDGGRENIDFIRHLMVQENNAIDFVAEDFREFVIDHVQKWGPTLLMYRDVHVRNDTLQLVDELLLLPLQGGEDAVVRESARDALFPHARGLAFSIHIKVNDMIQNLEGSEGRARRAQPNASQYLEALKVLQRVEQVVEDEEVEGWKDVVETIAWLRAFIEANESEEDVELDDWTQNPSDSEDPEMQTEDASFVELSP